ncbi:MAG: hypothetical protein M1816_001917 [Peltula sp. TS41687]|nr:MAG: hypothetical protein M1816_001917 [Peltula sp. TS41687]
MFWLMRYSSSVLLLLLLSLFWIASDASILFQGGTVIAFDEATESLQVLRDNSVLVTNDRIAAIFSSSSNATLPQDIEAVDITGKILSTGFIDTHRHGWQTAFKTIGSNTSLAEYFGRYGEFALAVQQYTPEDVYIGQLAGLYEALNAGVTTTLDHAHHTWSVETAAAGLAASIESGGRVFWCYTFHNIPNNFSVPQQMANFRNIASNGSFKNTSTSLGIAYDSFDSSDRNQTSAVIALAREYNVSVVTTHSLQGPWGGINDPEDVQSFDFLNTSIPIVFSHGSFITASQAQLLRQTNQYISITPESEMHYGHGHPTSHLIQDQAALGVDTHFTFSTDILTQARIWLQHARQVFYQDVLDDWHIPRNNPESVNQAFLLATRHGGLALRRSDLGVLAVGAKADLLVWNGNSPSLLGWDDPVAAIILHANVGDIEHVLVDGKFKKRDGKLVVEDYPAVQQRFLRSARRIQQVWREYPLPVLQGQFASGCDYADTMTADTLRGPGNGYGETFV